MSTSYFSVFVTMILAPFDHENTDPQFVCEDSQGYVFPEFARNKLQDEDVACALDHVQQ